MSKAPVIPPARARIIAWLDRKVLDRRELQWPRDGWRLVTLGGRILRAAKPPRLL